MYWSVAYALAVLACLRSLLVYVETRPSVGLADPLLASFTAIDLSWYIFALIYGLVVLAVTGLLDRPRQLLVTLLAYALLTNLRLLTLYLVPLKEPSGMILLQDPVLESFLGADFPVCRDLFFSGHTATAFLFCLTAGRRWLRPVLCAATFLTGLFLILQHVHYTVDIVAAPFFALGSYRLALAILRRRPGSAFGMQGPRPE